MSEVTIRVRILLLAIVASSGCFSPRYTEGSPCEAGTRACPGGYWCGNDDRCWSSGHGADAGHGDASDDAMVCVPLTVCPTTVACGDYSDPCSGSTLHCGSTCQF